MSEIHPHPPGCWFSPGWGSAQLLTALIFGVRTPRTDISRLKEAGCGHAHAKPAAGLFFSVCTCFIFLEEATPRQVLEIVSAAGRAARTVLIGYNWIFAFFFLKETVDLE